MDWIPLIAIVASLLLLGFFTGVEIAFVSVSKLSIELRKKQGNYAGRSWAAFKENPARFIGTMLIAFNILLVVYGMLWSDIIDKLWVYWRIENPFLRLSVEALLSTIVLLFFELQELHNKLLNDLLYLQ